MATGLRDLCTLTDSNYTNSSGILENIKMEIPVEEEEIKFQSNYRLVEIGKQTLGSPMAALGFPGLSHGVRSADTTMDIHLKKLESYSKNRK